MLASGGYPDADFRDPWDFQAIESQAIAEKNHVSLCFSPILFGPLLIVMLISRGKCGKDG
jgi:hypothetical protein